MIRTQIQLTEEQVARLKAFAAVSQVSMAELIRMSIESFLLREAGMSRDRKVARAKAAVGRFESGLPDVGEKHDKYLAEAFGRS